MEHDRPTTRIILVTDGDDRAREAVELAGKTLGLRVISRSAGNPTPLTGPELVDLIRMAPYDPVLVMVDDRGRRSKGKGETAAEYLASHPEIEVLGAVAVASDTDRVHGVHVDSSVTADGQLVPVPVDKFGEVTAWSDVVRGDTVDVLERLLLPVVIGTGDPGKMRGHDGRHAGAPITTRAIQEILSRHHITLPARNPAAGERALD